MFEYACVVDAGVGGRKNDDRASVDGLVVESGLHAGQCNEACLAVVCDGVGGEIGGSVAADCAVRYFAQLAGQCLSPDALEAHIEQADQLVVKARLAYPQQARLSTTVAGIYLCGRDYIAFNVGDSRVYRYRKPYLAQLSLDHSLAQEQREIWGAARPGAEHIITRCLGDGGKPEIVEGKGRVLDTDLYMVCSDGVHGTLSDRGMELIFSHGINLEELCIALMKEAIHAGSCDNQSIILIRRVSHEPRNVGK